MIFKDLQVQDEFTNKIPCFLRYMGLDLDLMSQSLFNKEITITRVLEFVAQDSGIHEHHGAFDIRNEHDSLFTFTQYECSKLCDFMNEKYKRYDGKPTMIFHSFQGGMNHGHIQIHLSMDAYIPKGA